MPKTWEPLRDGDSVALVNACMQDRKNVENATQYKSLLEEKWNYRISNLSELENEKGSRLWSGTPEERANRVISAITNPDNKAIFLLVGGDGANEAMKLVENWHLKEIAEGREGLPKRGIPVIGLSNNTTLLNPLAQMGIISPIQGKLDAAIASEENAEALHDLLSQKTPTLEFQVQPINSAARNYQGETNPVEIVGGCNFHVIESARTPFALDTKGKYLAVEGPEEQCSTKETLEGLQREGMLDEVKGIFFGYIHGYQEQAKQDEIHEAAEKFNIPIYVGMPWGHIPPGTQKDVYLPLHTYASFAIKDGVPTLEVATTRSQENLDQSYKNYSETRENFTNKTREVSEKSVTTSMEAMLQDLEPINLRKKDVTMSFNPKYGDPISHMMGVSQSLSALLHKGILDGINSLTIDLGGLYDTKDGKALYRNLKGEKLTPPHKYDDGKIVDLIPDVATYEKELSGYLQDFSAQHLGGIKTEVGHNKIVKKEKINSDQTLSALAIDSLDSKLQNAAKKIDEIKNSKDLPQKSWVEKVSAEAPKKSREI